MRVILVSPISILLLSTTVARAQASGKPEFEVASIRPSPPPDPGVGTTVYCRGGPGTNDPGLYTCGNMNLRALIGTAYDIPNYRMTAPDWMLTTRFDVRAVVPEGTTKEQFSIMLRNLLADRFKVVVHRESRAIQRYELTVARNGPKLRPPAAAKEGDAEPFAPGPPARDKDGYPIVGRGIAIIGDRARMHWPDMTMDMLVQQLSNQLRGPVSDLTGLGGKYDIEVYWWTGGGLSANAPGAEPAALPADPGPTLTQALQDQLGLRVESKRGPVEFLVVDRAERMPTEN